MKLPFTSSKTVSPPALTSPHKPNPGKESNRKPHSKELQFLLLPAEATAHLQTNVNGCRAEEHEGEGMTTEDPPCIHWAAMGSFSENHLLLYLICYSVLVRVSLLATHVFVHRRDNLQYVIMRCKSYGQERKVQISVQRKELQPTRFKVNVQNQLKQITEKVGHSFLSQVL